MLLRPLDAACPSAVSAVLGAVLYAGTCTPWQGYPTAVARSVCASLQGEEAGEGGAGGAGGGAAGDDGEDDDVSGCACGKA